MLHFFSFCTWIISTSGSTTHHEMTEAAHREMAITFMNDYPIKYPDQVSAMSTDTFKGALKDFKIGVEAPELNELHDVDKVHVNAESILAANSRLSALRTNVINAIFAGNMKCARQWTGMLFDTLQDFYSHTNWIEMGGGVHPSWGIPGNVGPLAGPLEDTCVDCDDPDLET